MSHIDREYQNNFYKISGNVLMSRSSNLRYGPCNPIPPFRTAFGIAANSCKMVFIKKNPTRCNNVSTFYYSIFIRSSTCFGRHTAHHQEPKTAPAASGFSYMEVCWTCSWWTLSDTLCLKTSTNYTSKKLPYIKNQRLPMQF
jgi:hypothetical protein